MIKKIMFGFSLVALMLIVYLNFALLIRINNENQAQTEAIKYVMQQNQFIINQNNAIIKSLKGKWV